MKLFGRELGPTRRPVNPVDKPLEEIEKSSVPKANMRPMGVTGTKASSGKVTEEFLSTLQWPDACRVYQEMGSNDSVIGGCLYLIETMLRKARWHVIPGGDEQGDKDAATFLQSCMDDMDGQTWDDFICDAQSMIQYGFSFHEIVYKTRRGPLERDRKFHSAYTDGRIGWQQLPVRSQATLDQWIFDEATGETLAFRQDPSRVQAPGPVVDIPLEGNLLFKTKAMRGNPEGWSILRRCYREWYFKRYIEELEGIGIERNMAGIPVITPPPEIPLFDPDNPEMVNMLTWAQSLVDGLRQDKNHGVVLPSGWTLNALSSNGKAGGIDTDTVIRRHENRMAMALLADVILMGGDRTGSFALAETKQSLLVSSIQTMANGIAATINSIAVPRLFAINNWTLEKLPKIAVDKIIDLSVSEIALLLRSFKIDVTRNKSLFDHITGLMQAPTLTQEEYDALIAAQPEKNTEEQLQDAVDNEAKPTGGNEV